MSRILPGHLPIFVSVNPARLPPLDPDVYDISALSQPVDDIRKEISEEISLLSENELTTLKEQLSDLHIMKTQITEITNHLSAFTNFTNHFSQNRNISLFVLRLSPDSTC